MIKQGLLKRVLGGVMAATFAACLAFPVTANAAEEDRVVFSVPTYNDGEILAIGSKTLADDFARAAQQNMQNVQFAVGQQVQYGAALAKTDVLNQQTQAYLGAAWELTRIPEVLDAAIAVDDVMTVRMDYLAGQVNDWRDHQIKEAKRMQNNLSISQTYTQMAVLGTQIGALERQAEALMTTAIRQTNAVAAIDPININTTRFVGQAETGAWDVFIRNYQPASWLYE